MTTHALTLWPSIFFLAARAPLKRRQNFRLQAEVLRGFSPRLTGADAKMRLAAWWQGRTGRVRRAAFSLIEVNLAVLLISVGLLVLFALFPLGLREGENAILDTHEAMFADHVLSAIVGMADDITDWSQWQGEANFRNALVALIPGGDQLESITIDQTDGEPHRIAYPKILGAADDVLREIRYRCYVSGNGDLKTVTLKVRSGRYGDFSLATTYTTQLVYMGM